MSRWWGADVTWDPQKPKPLPPIVLLVAALLGAVVIAAYRYEEVWTPLQRRYVASYVWSGLAFTTSGRYDLLYVVDRQGRRPAFDEELVSVTAATGETSFELSDAAVKTGAKSLAWQQEPYPHVALHRFLRRWIYHDQTLLDLVAPTLWGALAVFLGGIIGARSQAVVHARTSRTRYAMREADWTVAPAVIDVDGTPRARGAGAFADRGSDAPRRPAPAGLPGTSTRPLAGGSEPRPRGSAEARPESWPDPSFK